LAGIQLPPARLGPDAGKIRDGLKIRTLQGNARGALGNVRAANLLEAVMASGAWGYLYLLRLDPPAITLEILRKGAY
jgi:hypothetical protein